MKRILNCLVLVLSLLSVAGGGVLHSQEQQSPGRLLNEKIAVSLVQWKTGANGAKRKTGSADSTLMVGQRRNLHASTGFVDRDGTIVNSLCSNSIGTDGDQRALLANPAHLWWVEVEVIEATTQHIELAIEWQRHDRDAKGNAIVAREGRRTITLKEEESHVVDFIEPRVTPEEADRCGLNVVYELQTRVVEDPELADANLTYFFWVFDWDTGKPRRTQTFYAYGSQGEQADVETAFIRWPIGRQTPDGQTADVVTEIRASLRGRLRPDGSIDLFLGAKRQVGVARPGQNSRGGVGGSGERMFNIRPGECIELVMPTPQGAHTEWIDPEKSRGRIDTGPGADGIAVAENLVRVDFEPFFATRKMSIFVTATITDPDEG